MLLTKNSAYAVLLFVMCGCLLLASSADAQTVHTLLVVMDADMDIGPGMTVNRHKFDSGIASIDRVYPTNKTVYLSSRNETTKANVLQWVNNVRPSLDDVVLVYYTGHGGMMSQTDRRTFLYLSDGSLFRAELAAAIQAKSCRLKLLITDCCSSYPMETQGNRPLAAGYAVETVGKSFIRNLFGEHQGFLHVNGATEGQYGWAHLRSGSHFTVSLLEAISSDSDTNRDGFVGWGEVFELAKEGTTTRWRKMTLPDTHKNDPQATPQVPQLYSLPRRDNSKPPPAGSDDLWEMPNPRAGFTASLSAEKSGDYRIGDYLTLEIQPEEDCYVMLLNWDEAGTLTQLFPNKYQPNNFVQGAQTYRFPGPNANFDFKVAGPVGKERFKLIAFLNESDSQKVTQVIPQGGAFPTQEIRPLKINIVGEVRVRNPRDIADRDKKEAEIVRTLRSLNASAWAVRSTTINVR